MGKYGARPRVAKTHTSDHNTAVSSMVVLETVYYFKQFQQNPAPSTLIFVTCYMFSNGAGAFINLRLEIITSNSIE